MRTRETKTQLHHHAARLGRARALTAFQCQIGVVCSENAHRTLIKHKYANGAVSAERTHTHTHMRRTAFSNH